MLLALAIFLQVQLTLFAHEGYEGLRVSIADLLLPFAGIGILVSLALKRSAWPRWETPFGYWALALLSLCFAGAILQFYHLHGHFNMWGMLNKGVGWLVLLAYVAMGAWFIGNMALRDIYRWFVLPFLAFMIGAFCIEAALRVLFYELLYAEFIFHGINLGYDLSGFMVNRNAYAFLYLSAMVLGGVLLTARTSLNRYEIILFKSFYFFVPLFLTLNLSRSALLILIPLLVFLCVKNWRFVVRQVLPLFLIGALFIPLMNLKTATKTIQNFDTIEKIHDISQGGETAKEDLYTGDRLRLRVLEDAWVLIQERPITGSGLGGLLHYQQEATRKQPTIMDNTMLWVLTEMGVIGLVTFLGVYGAMLVTLYRQNSGDKEHEVFIRAVFFMLIGFGIFSLTHEVFYSRFLWFFLGLGLAVPFSMRQQRSKV